MRLRCSLSADIGDSADQEFACTWPENMSWWIESAKMGVGLSFSLLAEAGEADLGIVGAYPCCRCDCDCKPPASCSMLK